MPKVSSPWLSSFLSTVDAPASMKKLVTVGLVIAAGSLTAHAASQLRVETKEGPVKGFIANNVAEYLGIPYAAPPVGDLRWRPPRQHEPWTKVLQATAFGPQCAQTQERPFNGPPNNNEDCLYINVFTPSVDPGKREKLPVMFWSYGGGEADGESNDYDGSKLAYQGHVVVVTFNYRMNLMGFLAHPALNNEGHLFANYGLLDNQFALKWVHQNIGNFGGDPNNVTVFGQSAGSRNSASEVVSPLAKGLFQRAIFESGAIPPETPLSIAEQKAIAFAVAAGCGSGTDAKTAKCLRALTAAQVEALSGTVSGNSAYVTGLIVDGQILPEPAIDQYTKGNFNHVPILDGDVLNEGTFELSGTEYYESPRTPLTEDQFLADMTKTYSGNAGPGGSLPAYPAGTVDKVLKQYPLNAYPSPELQWAAVRTDSGYTCPTRHVNQILANQVPLYSYEFRDQTAPIYGPQMPGFTYLAYHTSDIQYYWRDYHGGPLGVLHPLNKKQQKLSDQLITAWSNFARTGNPNGLGNTPWPRYLPKKNGLYFTENIAPVGLGTETDAFWSAEHKCDFWDKILVYKPAVSATN
jgi:para-nitrobenzyl esterase